MKQTEYPEVNEALHTLLFNLQQILEAKLLGLYVYGSLVLGDFDRNVSDIDLLAAIRSPINEREFEDLKTMHQVFIETYPEWNDRIEVQYLTLEALKTFKEKESEVITISPGDPLQRRMVGDHWLMNWYVVREKGLALFGPDSKTIIEPISKEEFVQSVKRHTQNWNEWVKGMDSTYAQAYTILTLCRAYYASKNGEQVSKKQAAEWTQIELPEYSRLIQTALIWREAGKGDKGEDLEHYPKTVDFVHFIREQVLNT